MKEEYDALDNFSCNSLFIGKVMKKVYAYFKKHTAIRCCIRKLRVRYWATNSRLSMFLYRICFYFRLFRPLILTSSNLSRTSFPRGLFSAYPSITPLNNSGRS